ncbi:aminotransferase class IV [Deinococcus arcticus]|uniref:Aminotransferase class IV n=1 Tax=Deinococcus arcticus TaxID=2136176 RepID=A0A2T3W6B4_9DEIO|nr:aminotransferase class IV [Deinococcus arcticus]PTA67440.1 aminotransferase class IV [Deinococcus arcticus]
MKPLPDELKAPAWLHGISAFTTVRTRHGTALLWPEHLARLRGTCMALGLPAPAPDLPPLLPLPWGLLRVTVTEEDTFWSHAPLTPGPRPERGVTVRLTTVQTHPQLAGHKTGNYLPYRLALQEAAPAFEGWLTDTGGQLVDGARTSPVLELGGALVVPAGGLPGLTRSAWLAGQAFTQRPVQTNELPGVTRAWICGSGVGVVPVRRLEGPDFALDLPLRWPATDHAALIWPGG